MCGTDRCKTCTSCGDTTPGKGAYLRCAEFAVDPSREIVGTSAGVTQLPTARIVDAGNVLGYEQLFTEINNDGGAQVYRNPGTFGQLHQVGRRY